MTTVPIPWTTGHAQALREFLGQVPLIQNLKMPAIDTRAGMETGALTGAAHSGAEDIMDQIRILAAMQPETENKTFLNTGRDSQ